VIVAMDGTQITDEQPLVPVIRQFDVGETVTLELVRDGTRITREVALSKTPEQ